MLKNIVIIFEEKKNPKIIKTLQHTIIKWSKDKKTGLINEDYPPTMNLKLPFIRGKPNFTIINFKGEPVDDMDLKSLFVKGKKIQAVIRCEDIWKYGENSVVLGILLKFEWK